MDSSETASTRVAGVSPRVIVARSSPLLAGLGGKSTRFTWNPRRAACASQASPLLGWFWSVMTTSSPAPSSSPAITMLFPSEAFRMIANSSGSPPRKRATRLRTVSRRVLKRALLWKETSASTERLAASTAAMTSRGGGHMLAAFIGTRLSPNPNSAWRVRQADSPSCISTIRREGRAA